jgi:hypothetical protein
MRAAPGWGHNINDEQAEFYTNAIVTIDASVASKAILDGISEWKFAPSLAQLYERVKTEKEQSKYRTAVDHRINLPEREPIPQWAQRWMCARFLYEKFAEQRPHLTGELMPDDEWAKEAGSVNPETFARLWGHITAGGIPDDSPATIKELLSGP